MSETIPKGWTNTTYSEVLSRRKETHTNDGTYPLYSLTIEKGVTPKSDRYEREFLVRDKEAKKYAVIYPNDLVFNPSNLRWGAIARSKVSFKVLASPIYEICEPNIRKITPEYLGYLATSDLMMRRYLQFVQGTLVERTGLHIDDFLPIPISIPSLTEQQKIAEILTSVDEVIENTQSQIGKLEDLKQATVNELLTKGVGHTEFKETEIGRIPRIWQLCTLEELSEYRRGSFPQPYGLPKWFSESGYPFVQVFDISDNGRLKESTKEKISDLAAEKSVFVKKGSLIVSLQGSIGRIAITHYDAYVDRTILIFTKFHRPIDLTYFSQVIERLFAKKKDEADGGVIKTITKETLSNFQVALPPIEEQRRISSVLLDHSVRIADLRQKSIGLRNLKVSLMQDLLTGKVRVTVN